MKQMNEETLFCGVLASWQKVDPKNLEPFRKEMQEETIPAIVEIMKKRATAAARSRHNVIF